MAVPNYLSNQQSNPFDALNLSYNDTMKNSGFSGGTLNNTAAPSGWGVLDPSGGTQSYQDFQGNLGQSVSPPAADGGGTDFLGADGWGNLALGGIQTGLGAYMGFKQLGAAKDQLNFQKESFNKNYEASKQTTNTQLRDRQKRRYAENPDHYKSESEYMKTNGIK